MKPTARINVAKTQLAADQVLVSGGSFLSTVLIARLLDGHEFGIYSISWLITLFLSTLAMGGIVFPMMSSYHRLSDGVRRQYLAGNYVILIGGAVTASLFAGGIVFVAFSSVVADAGTIALVAACAISGQLQEITRRIHILREDHKRLICSELATYGTRVVVLAAIYARADLAELSLILGLVTCTNLFGCLTFDKSLYAAISRRSIVYAWKRNVPLAQWLLPSGVLQWLFLNVALFSAALWTSPQLVGQLRMCQNLAALTNPILQLADTIAPASISKRFQESGVAGLRKFVKVLIVAGVGPFLIVLPAVHAYANQILIAVYGASVDGGAAALSLFFLIQPTYLCLIFVRSSMWAVGAQKVAFTVSAWVAILAVPAAYFAATNSPMLLIPATMLASCFLALVLTGYLLLAHIRQSNFQAENQGKTQCAL